MSEVDPAVRIALVGSLAEWLGAVAVRIAVFVDEQRVPFFAELDDVDSAALHAVAVAVPSPDNPRVVGTARIFPAGDREYRFGRLAVLPPWRRRGLGTRLLRLLEDAARSRGARRVTLHAQTYVESFYARQGYAAPQPRHEFLEDGIPHVRMSKSLPRER